MTAIIHLITFFWTFFLFITLIYLLQGPPFVPSDDKTTKQLTDLVKKFKAKHVIDLGSGDGKLVISLAKNGIRTDGIELNPSLVKSSIKKIKNADFPNLKPLLTQNRLFVYKF